jgi:hypothetical protein
MFIVGHRFSSIDTEQSRHDAYRARAALPARNGRHGRLSCTWSHHTAQRRLTCTWHLVGATAEGE